MKSVILAAGTGKRLGNHTKNIPKCLLKIGNKTLLERSLENLNKQGIEEVIIVIGYLGHKIKEKIGDSFGNMKIRYVENKEYSTTNNMFSLSKSKPFIEDEALIVEGDLLYELNALKSISKHAPNVTLISSVSESNDEGYVFINEKGNLKDITLDYRKKKESQGELVGITKLSKDFLEKLFEISDLEYNQGIKNQTYYDMILKTSKIIPVKCFYNGIIWIGINNEEDLIKANNEIIQKIDEKEN